tara:strand:+ start:1249 stop:1692 length:444 start_codon:yes stop_codon:yes gene_type:complete
LSEAAINGLVTLQERMVNLINQLNMPIIEVSMVIQNMLSPMLESLKIHVAETGMEVPDKIINQWPIDVPNHHYDESTLDIDKLLSVVDRDRMDILEALVRVTMVETEMILLDGISALRMWEHLVRSKLVTVTSPGQLFSPLEIPEEW